MSVKPKTALFTLLLLIAAATLACADQNPPATPSGPATSQAAPTIGLTPQNPAQTQAATPTGTQRTPSTPPPTPEGGPQTRQPTGATIPAQPWPTGLTVGYAEQRQDQETPTLVIPAATPVQLTAYALYSDSTYRPVPPEQARWDIDDRDRFTLTESGVINATHQATSHLRLTAQGLSALIHITAEGPPYRTTAQIDHLVIEPKNMLFTGLGKTATVTVRAVYADRSKGPLPQTLPTQVEFSVNPTNVAKVNRQGTVTPLALGTAQMTAKLADKTTREPTLIHVTPVTPSPPPDTGCTTRYPSETGTEVYANSFAIQLYPAHDTVETATALARTMQGEHAQHIPSRKIHIIHLQCPPLPQSLLKRTIEKRLEELYDVPQVAYAEPQHTTAATAKPQHTTAATAKPTASPEPTPNPEPILSPSPRPGDHIVQIETHPRSVRLTPGQWYRLNHVTVRYADGTSKQLPPGHPELDYTIHVMGQPDHAHTPELTRHIKLTDKPEILPLPTVPTISYNLVAHHLGHRSRTRIDIRATPEPLTEHPDACAPPPHDKADIMLETRPQHYRGTPDQVAAALGATITRRYPSFNGAVITMPCSSRHHTRGAIETAMEFPAVVAAYIHLPTKGDGQPSVLGPILPSDQTTLVIRRGRNVRLDITQATFDDGTTGPIPPPDLRAVSLHSHNTGVATVVPPGLTVRANAPGVTTVQVLYRGKIAATVPVRVIP